MNKKSLILLFIGLILTGAIIFLGKNYSVTKKNELLRQGEAQERFVQGQEENQTTNEKNNLEAKALEFQNKRANLSINDYLTLVNAKNNKVTLAFYGDNSETEQWTPTVKPATIEKTGLANLEMNRFYFPGYDSLRLTNENASEKLIQLKPDVVFFFIPVVGNQAVDISLDASIQAILASYQALKEQLPDSLIVAVTPVPSSSLMNKFNSRTLDYTSYVTDAVTVLTENEVPLLDLHSLYLSELETTNQLLANTLESDGIQLNPQGVTIATTLFLNQLASPRDTTSGID
ncbi:SGNH/GDSL hydrolase family protein [Carnobacterium maltaromaticum]|uniref:SGNH/GDSL hydrolase family protein n=1 Tax=Carnobacterium maltaromaticum TaxID=2751 RepID=UPI000C781279|nr:SGNH/GDSL hydrolase family protein [Carnobacterium maltaromaticum]PLS36724.1 SGNH/GDSL hydrolase family protein [Carnobacterium maltaromaticum]PLS37539.1 SGNH/GDSL hydrolase family protein [Carnobacterium maltaromaticum]PLS39481.1 SGNH/GDSL hydrolase family protein [Carnobacterium maltaromaticum]PLS44236.1 SGNH/GDSL hydrolase family protein [Carnobacterium maltaromaticum]PLS46270.1 SGNH/GDSL hydrolase family protein [Carnobacterium maltaromaticum]